MPFTRLHIYINSLIIIGTFSFVKAVQGVSKIVDGYNPATWMLEVSSSAQEIALGVDFAEIYKNSDLHR